MSLYNPHPPKSTGKYPHDDGWTRSLEGAIHEAKKLSTALSINEYRRGNKYKWFITLRIHPVLTPKQHQALWNKAGRKLKMLDAFWIRESTPNDKLHYHLIVANDISLKAIRDIFNSALPSRSILKWQMRIQEITDTFGIAQYICKAKRFGKVKIAGEYILVADKYKAKRHIFLPNCGLNKHGAFGRFWVMPPKKIWADVIQHERGFADVCRKMGIPIHEAKYILKWANSHSKSSK